MTLSSFYTQVLGRLQERLPAQMGPASSLPTQGGKVAQSAVLWPTAGTMRHRANAGQGADRVETFTVICLGPSALDALAAADKVRAALTGLVLRPGASPMRETGVPTSPAAEPNTDPVRVSLSLQFTTISKEL